MANIEEAGGRFVAFLAVAGSLYSAVRLAARAGGGGGGAGGSSGGDSSRSRRYSYKTKHSDFPPGSPAVAGSPAGVGPDGGMHGTHGSHGSHGMHGMGVDVLRDVDVVGRWCRSALALAHSWFTFAPDSGSDSVDNSSRGGAGPCPGSTLSASGGCWLLRTGLRCLRRLRRLRPGPGAGSRWFGAWLAFVQLYAGFYAAALAWSEVTGGLCLTRIVATRYGIP